jgi:transcriptional regulator with XRE-family HTH domain
VVARVVVDGPGDDVGTSRAGHEENGSMTGAQRDHGLPADDSGVRNVTPATGPTVLRIGLGSMLRRLREQAGIDRETAGHAIRASTAKISRLELGRVGFKIRDVDDLIALYGITDRTRRAEFLDLARRANEPGWWHRYADLLPSWFETYLGLEQAASVIRTFELQFVPGLLQTPDYARAVTRLAYTRLEEIERRVELRMRRQHLLSQAEPPTLWAVVDESALRRSVGSEPAVLRAQLTHLLEMNERPNVSLQFVPLSHGGHAAAGGSFTLLRFAQPDLPDVVYLEQLTSALYLDKQSDTDHYVMVMDRLVTKLEPPNRAARILDRIRSQL